mgnify:CR=1 FL=1
MSIRAHGSKHMDSLDFVSIQKTALAFARHIESHFEEIASILLEYESFEVVEDEVRRTLDLFNNLHENKKYFVLRINEVTSFLPRNQPLYAFSCFVAVPSLMAQNVYFRIPQSMRGFFPKLLQVLKIAEFFPNIIISNKERLEFLKERSALLVDPKQDDSLPVTDAVIFTGISHHAERLRCIFDPRTLFIANGSGHNPLVIAENADIPKAAEAALKLQLYNQGQDCAAPNAILVHRQVYQRFLRLLRSELQKIKTGPYDDQSCTVGPMSEPDDLKRIGTFMVDNRNWLDASTPGIIRTAEAMVEPTMLCKPLKAGGNFTEIFAPIIFVQKYEQDDELSLYFENSHYARNAMYVTLYGDSVYINNLIGRKIEGKVLHQSDTFLHNTHLHAPGIERGTQPYGGYGYSASSISLHGKIDPKPTCPQRDIYERLVKPLLKPGKIKEYKDALRRMTKREMKNIPKLMGLRLNSTTDPKHNGQGKSYLDFLGLESGGVRYQELPEQNIFSLLEYPNAEFISHMDQGSKQYVHALRKSLLRNKKMDQGDFAVLLYSIPKKPELSEHKNKIRQLHFFRNIYHLLFGKESGPRLAQFLLDADRSNICELLDV